MRTALARCDRQEQLWAHAYEAEAITLEEYRLRRGDVETTRQHLLTEQTALHLQRDSLDQLEANTEQILSYVSRVRDRLSTFTMAEQRLAVNALNVKVTYHADHTVDTEGVIPLGEISSLAPQHV